MSFLRKLSLKGVLKILKPVAQIAVLLGIKKKEAETVEKVIDVIEPPKQP